MTRFLTIFFFCAIALSDATGQLTMQTIFSPSNTTKEEICIGGTETVSIVSFIQSGPNLIHKWTVEKCDNPIGSTGCTTFVFDYDQTTPATTTQIPVSFDKPGRFRVLVELVNTQTGQVLAESCTNCTNATMDVFGVPDPEFEVNEFSCQYDPTTDTYSSIIFIEPAFNNSFTSVNGNSMTIVWGDGSQDPSFNPNTTGSSRKYHTYTWSGSAPPPQFNISVNVWPMAINPTCPDKSYSQTYIPYADSFNEPFEVVESNCDVHMICFANLENYLAVYVYDPTGELIDRRDPSVDPCFSFTDNGTYSLLFSDGEGLCPQLFQYNVSTVPEVGYLSSSDLSINPGEPLNLNLGTPNDGFIVYEVLAEGCYGYANPDWNWNAFILGADPGQYTMPANITDLIKPCYLNEDFEICIRARVYCSEEGLEDYYVSGISNTICLPICMIDCETPGGGGGGGDNPDDPNDDGQWIRSSGNTDTEQDSELNEKSKNETVNPTMNVYPNPARDQFFVEIDQYSSETSLTIQIMDIKGQVVQTVDDVNPNGGVIDLDLNQQPAGLFHVILKDDTSILSRESIIKIR